MMTCRQCTFPLGNIIRPRHPLFPFGNRASEFQADVACSRREENSMKIPIPENQMLPDPEFDEFGDKIIRPIESGRSADGRIIYMENLHEWNAYEKQLSRNRDARMLERGEIDKAGLIRKTACSTAWTSARCGSRQSGTEGMRTSTNVYDSP